MPMSNSAKARRDINRMRANGNGPAEAGKTGDPMPPLEVYVGILKKRNAELGEQHRKDEECHMNDHRQLEELRNLVNTIRSARLRDKKEMRAEFSHMEGLRDKAVTDLLREKNDRREEKNIIPVLKRGLWQG